MCLWFLGPQSFSLVIDSASAVSEADYRSIGADIKCAWGFSMRCCVLQVVLQATENDHKDTVH
jgi:hypothetical protein